MWPFSARLIFAYFFLPVSTSISIFRYCDALLFMIIVIWLAVSRLRLFWLCFLMDWCNFTTSFIFIIPLISAAYPFSHGEISHLVGFHLLLIELRITYHLSFDICVFCSCFCLLWICGSFRFHIPPLEVCFFWRHLGLCRALISIDSYWHYHGLGAHRISGWLRFS